MSKYNEKLKKVEQTIILFLLWREINGEKKWYKEGCKKLTEQIKRSKKAVQEALESLSKQKMILFQKKSNKLWIKLSLSDEEKNTRLSFICESFSSIKSMLELEEDLVRKNIRLDEEIRKTNEKNAKVQNEDWQIKVILQNITRSDIRKLAKKIILDRTWVNSNKPLEEIIKEELPIFRDDMFNKYRKQRIRNNTDNSYSENSNIYEQFWPRYQRE